MKHITRRIFVPTFALVLISAVCFAFAMQIDSIFTSAGRLQEKKLQGAQPSTEQSVAMFAVGEHGNIPQSYYDCTVEELQLSGHSLEDAKELASSILIEKFSLYQAAIEADCVPSDEDVSRIIADTRAGIATAENRSAFYLFLDGTGMTEDEYWDSQFENVKIYEAIANYKAYCHEHYLMTTSDEGSNATWSATSGEIVTTAIANEHITFS